MHQLGNEEISTQFQPVPVTSISGAVSIAAIHNASFAVLSDGKLYWWGTITAGTFPNIVSDSSTPNATLFPLSAAFPDGVPLFSAVYTAPAYGGFFSKPTMFLIAQNGSLFSYGSNSAGQLCANAIGETPLAQQVLFPLGTSVKDISIGVGAVFMLAQNGSIYGCGWNGPQHIVINATIDVCSLGDFAACYNPSQAVLVPTRIAQPFNESDLFSAISAAGNTLFAINREGILHNTYRGALDRWLESKAELIGLISTRRLVAMAALNLVDFIATGPVEFWTDTPQLPDHPQTVKILGRGFPTQRGDRPWSNAPFNVTLGSQPCLVISASDEPPSFTCNPGLGTIGTFPWGDLNSVVRILGEPSEFNAGVVVPPPSLIFSPLQYLCESGFRTVPLRGSSLGDRVADLQVTFFDLGTSGFRTVATVESASDSQLSVTWAIPAQSSGTQFSVYVTRLTAQSYTESSQVWAVSIPRTQHYLFFAPCY